jgi:BirA family biotin operon repressor/biotin-[acetyl-CoA-carboxylase] ligase
VNSGGNDRRPIAVEPVRKALDGSRLWFSVDYVESIGSTNSEMALRAQHGARHGSLLVTDEQTAGRGRRERGWNSPPYSSVMVSAVLRPDVESARWGWLPLIIGIAIAEAVKASQVGAVGVKWPNDVMVADQKIAGILCEVVNTSDGPAVIAGWGLNVDQRSEELPGDGATSLRLLGVHADRDALLVDVLHRWERLYGAWRENEPELTASYTSLSTTLGQPVRAELPDSSVIKGRAVRLDASGSLVVDAGDAEHVLPAADVVHVRGSE